MGKKNITNIVDGVFCISLIDRKDRRKKIKKHMKKKKISFKFYNAIKNTTNPAMGCLQSHLNIIKNAKRDNLKAIMIIEDDCLFIKKPVLNLPPKDWDMLYLRGNLEEVIEKNDKETWYRMRCWTTHSYIIKQSMYDIIIKGLKNYKQEIDKFYCEEIHKKYKCYMCDPAVTKQMAGYSDIVKKEVNYEYITTPEDLIAFKEPEYEKNGDELRLKLKNYEDIELPFVSIITPTKNRKVFFELAINNFLTQDYPTHLLEWIIIDDSDDESQYISEMLPKNDNRIKHIKIKNDGNGEGMTISKKRNMGFQQSKGDIIIHMDDDDYYLPSSVSTRVKILLYYKEQGISCVGCERFGCHDLEKDSSFIIDKNNEIAEASMGYFRSFIEERQFNEFIVKGEGKLFCRGRNQHIMKLPFEFIFISFTHGKNTHIRKNDNDNSNGKFGFDYGVFKIIKKIKKQLF
jgi:hypothetical protein